MKDLIIWDTGGHSNLSDDLMIQACGYKYRYQERVAPAVAKARKLGYRPVIVERAPGSRFGKDGFPLRDFLNLAGTDWYEMTKRATMPSFWNRVRGRGDVEYRVYLYQPESDTESLALILAILRQAGIGAYFEGVTDTPERTAARLMLANKGLFFGNEPVPDRAHPLACLDPFIVDEKMLVDEGRDYLGKNWSPYWLPLAPGQKRTLILHGPPTLQRFKEVEEAGWTVGVIADHLVEM